MEASGAGSVAVVIVNYGTADLALEAIESVISRRHGGRAVEVHVVDNASPDGDAQVLEQSISERGWADRVTLWAETENHGFGRGNNLVLRALSERPEAPEFVFLLNPDARLENEAIDILASALEADPAAAAAGAAITLPDGTPVTAAFRFPSMTSEVLASIGFGPLDRLLERHRVPLSANTPAGPVGWVAGAAVLFRFCALRDVGFFDPRFFLYYEEVDLMRRLADAGWRTIYHPAALAQHHEGAATSVRSGDREHKRRPTYLYESWLIYFSKNHGRTYALVTALLVMLGGSINLFLMRVRGRRSALPKSFFSDQWRLVISPIVLRRGPQS